MRFPHRLNRPPVFLNVRPALILAAVTAVLSASSLAAVSTSPASAEPSPGPCAMDESRGEIPDAFPIDACVDGNSIWLRNDLAVPALVEAGGSAQPITKVETNQTLAAIATRAAHSDPYILLPGDVARIPIGSDQARVELNNTEVGGFYVLANTVTAFLPGAGPQVWDSVTTFITELNQVFGEAYDCRSGANFLQEAGCNAELAWDVSFALGRAVATGVAKGVVQAVLAPVVWAQFIDAQPEAVASLIGDGRLITQEAAVTVAPTAPPVEDGPDQDGDQGSEQGDGGGQSNGDPGSGTISLAQGGPAAAGSWYSVSLVGFNADTSVQVTCHDSVDPGGFITLTVGIDADGAGGDPTFCYSNDGPDHWVTTNNGATSNYVSWSAPSGGGGAGTPTESLNLAAGGSAPAGIWYDFRLTGYAPGAVVTVTCRDSVDPGGFWTQTFTIGADGTAGDSTLCYSGDGPDHWVTSDGGRESNHVAW